MPNDDNPLAQHKWVRIMADFLSDGVWDKDGFGCNLDYLPVSTTLRQRISAWVDWYDREADATGEYGRLDVRTFSLQGLAIAQDVKRELPSWTVVYFDELRFAESLSEANAVDRSYFEYPVESQHTDAAAGTPERS